MDTLDDSPTLGAMNSQRLLREREAAARLAISLTTIRRLRREGRISAVRINAIKRGAIRYEPEVIEAFIRDHREGE